MAAGTTKRILLTFTGFHDPFGGVSASGENEAGPVLTVTHERSFDCVYLFSTPATAESCNQTKTWIEKRKQAPTITVLDTTLKDPTNYLGILKQLRTHFKHISKDYPDAEYFICVSSGTPHMHASWLMLAASGEIPARILQTRALKFVRPGESQVTEIDFTNPQFPKISPFGILPDENETTDFPALCQSQGIIGNDENFLRELKKAFAFAAYNSPVLILGETGSGKEVFARFIHAASDRSGKPFLPVNCAGLPEALIESQLFGHRKGSFTGADRDHKGYFEAADGGTLFLDELGELPPQCQAKLLRAIQTQKIQRLGETKESSVNVRVIAATNVNVTQAIKDKKFRSDLYYRFEAKVTIPPLRNRRSDIAKIAMHFLDRWNAAYQKQRRFSSDALAAFTKHAWPGNVRELEGVVNRSAQLCSDKIIEQSNLIFDEVIATPGDGLPEPHDGFRLTDYLSDVRLQLIQRAMKQSNDNQSKAAELLGITPQAVSQYLKAQK